MNLEEHAQECNDALSDLIGKKILDVEFKPIDTNCWNLYITTNTGKMVMSFCKNWSCPEVENRN
jgi:hypothetical protein